MEFSTVSVVVPVYNSEVTLGMLVTRLEPVLRECTSTFEVILVNDGSSDKSWQVIEKLAKQYLFVQGLDLMRNYGQHNALLCGIRAARHEVIVTMDDDLQHPPEEIPILLNKLAEGHDVVYGTPQKRQHRLWRYLASQVAKLVLKSAMGAETARNITSFRTFRAHLRDAFADYESPFFSIDVLLTWGTTRFATTTVRHYPRQIGVSNYTFPKLVTFTFNMITGFSVLPLQLASLMGFIFALLGLVVLIYSVGRCLVQGWNIPGFVLLVSIIALFSGAQLLAIGFIGEYLVRMHFRMMNKPTYVIRQRAYSGREPE